AGMVGADIIILDGEMVVDNLILPRLNPIELVPGNDIALRGIGPTNASVDGLEVFNAAPVGQRKCAGNVSTDKTALDHGATGSCEAASSAAGNQSCSVGETVDAQATNGRRLT